ncbi:MAG: hypothetical protein MUQ30_19670 [Anaerolineae bacterium]|nr:hypothetical protein [Anaerolineae bacterium]
MVEETMSMSARYEYLRAMRDVYLRADRKEKKSILTHIKSATQYNRKYIITCLNDPDLQRHTRSRERGRKYGVDVAQAIGSLADALDWVCAERLQPALAKTARHMTAHDELNVSAAVLDKLEHISIATVARILKEIRPVERLPRAYSGRPPDTSAQRAVPVSIIAWDVPEPGHFEMDLVHHGVPDQHGRLICTIQFIDVLTGWSERFAIMGTGFDAIYDAIQAFRRRCPIPIREVHSDNGSEFINNALIAALGDEHLSLTQTRGRPGCHNDNRFVEQKNNSLVRAYLGSTPFHTPDELHRLQRLYDDMWVYYNLFQPVLRQTERTAATGADGIVRIRRSQDSARTPFDRLLEAKPPISRETQAYLKTQMDSTPLLALKRRIHQRIAELRAPADHTHQDNHNPV